MVLKRSRKRRGGSRRRVIANYLGTCYRLHGRKKTRCLLDQKRDFRDAFGFGGKEYDIYENEAAQQAFLVRFNDDKKLQDRVRDYLLDNNNRTKREEFYRKNKDNDVSPDDGPIHARAKKIEAIRAAIARPHVLEFESSESSETLPNQSKKKKTF